MRSLAFARVLLDCGDDEPALVVDAGARDGNLATERPARDLQAELTARLGGKTPEVNCGRIAKLPAVVDAVKKSSAACSATASSPERSCCTLDCN